MAGELQAVMEKNPKRSRHTCTKEYKDQLRSGQVASSDAAASAAPSSASPAPEAAMVWEISDGEDDIEPVAGLIPNGHHI